MMITNKSRGIYIHVPFCLSKCPYCDFYSVPRHRNENIEGYVTSLVHEIERVSCEHGDLPIETVYMGGGTPSLLEPSQVAEILDRIRACYDLLPDAEISMEANPATVSTESLAGYLAAGLNRLSIGAQSFDDEILKLLGRLHKAHQITKTVEAARDAGFDNISLDLMFGIDGQTQETWERSVAQAIALAPEHISLYSLEIMDNTRFARDEERGIYHQTAAELDRRMYHAALDMLEAAGYRQYEISNVAKPGFECRHNLRYWNMGEYIGFGPAAHSFVGGARYSNAADVNAYIASGGRPEICGRTQNTEQDNISEYMFTGLRRTVGISKADFREAFGRELWDVYAGERAEFAEFAREGFAEEDEDSIRLTRRGMDISNRIMAIFV